MRTLVTMALLAGIATPAAEAGDREKASAVIERAIKAHGGEDALNKAQKCSRRGKGVLTTPTGEVPFTTEETMQLPGRCRIVLEVERTRRQIIVLNGDKGWLKRPDGSVVSPKEEVNFYREEAHVWWLMTLTPLLKKEITLTPLADAKVNGQDAEVIKASSKGHGDIRLYFDKKTGMLVKIRRRAVLADVPLTKEYYYSDFQDCDGAKLPGKEIVMQYDQKQSEVKFSQYKSLATVDEATFKKP